jgi:hypothetical protein
MGDENTNNNLETDPIEFKHILSKISATELKRSEEEAHNPS